MAYKSSRDNNPHPEDQKRDEREDIDQGAGHSERGAESPYQGSGFGEINRTWSRSISRSRQSEVVLEAQKFIGEVVKDPQINRKSEFCEVLAFDADLEMAPISAVIQTLMSEDKKMVFYHVVLLEGSVAELGTEEMRESNLTFDRQVVASDFISDDQMVLKLQETVQRRFPDQEVMDTGYFVLWRETTLDENVAREVAYAAAMANEAYEDQYSGRRMFNIADIHQPKKETIIARVEFDSKHVEHNLNGAEIRTDFKVTTLSQTKDRNRRYAPNELMCVGGYVDLVLDQEAIASKGMAWGVDWGGNNQNEVHYYTPRVVLTLLENRFSVRNMETELLTISSATLMLKDNLWSGVFRPRHHIPEGEDQRDIGALNYELGLYEDDSNAPCRFPTKSESYSDRDAATLISRLLHPEPVISMQTIHGDERGWLHELLLNATDTSTPEGAEAYDFVCEAAQALTNNNFGKYFSIGTDQIGYPDQNLIPIGYFSDAGSEKRDLREIDRLAIMNIKGDVNMEMVDRFSECLDNVDADMELRLAQQIEILTDVVGPPRVKAVGEMFNFNGDFLQALVNGCHDAGLNIDPQTTNTSFNQSSRGNRYLRNMAVDSGFRNNMWNTRRRDAGHGSFGGSSRRVRW